VLLAERRETRTDTPCAPAAKSSTLTAEWWGAGCVERLMSGVSESAPGANPPGHTTVTVFRPAPSSRSPVSISVINELEPGASSVEHEDFLFGSDRTGAGVGAIDDGFPPRPDGAPSPTRQLTAEASERSERGQSYPWEPGGGVAARRPVRGDLLPPVTGQRFSARHEVAVGRVTPGSCTLHRRLGHDVDRQHQPIRVGPRRLDRRAHVRNSEEHNEVGGDAGCQSHGARR
jgi:hypothetical protein